MTTIIRDGETYQVIDETETDFAVLVEFDFEEPPYKRDLKLWWDKKYCIVVDE